LSSKLNRSWREDSAESWPVNAIYYHTEKGKGKQQSFFKCLLKKFLFNAFLVIFNGTERDAASY